MKRLLFILSIIIIFCNFESKAQKYLIHNYTEEDGLPNSSVFSVTQDKSGILYIATDNGIAEYDGYNWKTISEGIYSKNTVIVQIDSLQNLWAVTRYKNKYCLSLRQNGIWKNYPLPPINFFAPVNSSIYIDLKIAIYGSQAIPYISLFGAGIIYYENNKWEYITTSNGLLSNNVYRLAIDNNKIYAATDKGLSLIENKVVNNNLNLYLPQNNKKIYSIGIEKQDNYASKVWLINGSSIGYIENNRYFNFIDNLNIDTKNENFFYSIEPNFSNSIVVGNAIHSFIINKRTKTISGLQIKNGLVDNGCISMFKDNENLLWICSNRGLSKIVSLKFAAFFKQDGFLDDEVSAISSVDNDQTIVLGHPNGLTLMKDGEYKTIKFPVPTNKATYSLRVINFIKTKNDDLWFSANYLGIGKLNKNATCSFYNFEPEGRINGIAYNEQEDKIYAVTTGALLSFKNNKFFKESIPYSSFYRSLFFIDNELYVCTGSMGIFKRDIKGNWTKIISENDEANNIYCVLKTKAGKFLVGTNNGPYEIVKNELIPYPLNNQIIQKSIFSILQSDSAPETIWFGTNNGLIKKTENLVEFFATKDGLSGLESNRGANYIDKSGIIYFGFNKGFSIYNNYVDNNQLIKPLIEIKGLFAKQKFYDIQNDITLSSNENDLNFVFSAISFYNEKKNVIRYCLEKKNSSDTNWTETVLSLDNINFKNLSSGSYRLKLCMKNALGNWSDTITTKWIVIRPPIYLSWWFILITTIIVGIVFYLISHFNSLKKHKDSLEEKVSERTKLLEASEFRYRKLFEDNSSRILLIDPFSLDIIDANLSAQLFYGINLSQLQTKKLYDLNYDLNEKNNIYENLNLLTELTVNHKNSVNEIKYVILRLTHINNNDKLLTYAIVEDITGTKSLEKRFKKINEELEKRVDIRTHELEQAIGALYSEIEDREKAEKELLETKNDIERALEREKELSVLKSRFITTISHEYRTPLTVILSSIELIRNYIKLNNTEKIINSLNKMAISVKTLSNLVDNVINIGKKDKLIIEKDTIEINDLITKTVQNCSEIDNYDHDIIFKQSDSEIVIKSDENLLSKILINLISNACKYSNKGENIYLEAYLTDDNKLKITCEDFGMGIHESEFEVIFEPFYKSPDSIAIAPGSGLGLAIVQNSVSALNGEIKLKSEQGKGSIFTVILPIN